MDVADIVIAAGWAALWLYWLIAAVGVKAGQTNWARFAGLRVGIIVAILVLLHSGAFRGRSAVTSPWPQGIGLAVFVLGLALAIWARACLGRNWGMPMSQKADPALVTTGPYASIRHPIYSGIILAMIGTTTAASLYWVAAVLVIGAYFIYSAVTEERNMSRLFPDSYPGYQHSTKMLIPFIL